MNTMTTTDSTTWRTEWSSAAHDLTRVVYRSGRTLDSRNLGRLAVTLEMMSDDDSRQVQATVERMMTKSGLTARAFHGSLRRLTSAGLVKAEGVDGATLYTLSTPVAAANDRL